MNFDFSLSKIVMQVVISVAFGVIPFGLIIAGRQGTNLREEGSGNIGAANVYRALGFNWALTVFVLDAAKGFMPVMIAFLNFPGQPIGRVIAAVLVVAASIFNPIVKFKGGKGVSTAFGAFILLAPIATVACLILWAGIVFAKKIPSLGSLAAAALLPIMTLVNVWGRNNEMRISYIVCSLIVSALVALAHLENISRLMKGEEKPIEHVESTGTKITKKKGEAKAAAPAPKARKAPPSLDEIRKMKATLKRDDEE